MIKTKYVSKRYIVAKKTGNKEVADVLEQVLLDSLSARQIDVLNALRVNEPLSSRQIADELGFDNSYVCNVLYRLEEIHMAKRKSADTSGDRTQNYWLRLT